MVTQQPDGPLSFFLHIEVRLHSPPPAPNLAFKSKSTCASLSQQAGIQQAQSPPSRNPTPTRGSTRSPVEPSGSVDAPEGGLPRIRTARPPDRRHFHRRGDKAIQERSSLCWAGRGCRAPVRPPKVIRRKRAPSAPQRSLSAEEGRRCPPARNPSAREGGREGAGRKRGRGDSSGWGGAGCARITRRPKRSARPTPRGALSSDR